MILSFSQIAFPRPKPMRDARLLDARLLDARLAL
jgi:hypothetical protein